MKKLLLIGLFLLAACGKDGDQGPAGPAGASGLEITRVGEIASSGTDWCTQGSDMCLFGGGEILHFSDGSVLLTGAFISLIGASADIDSFAATVIGVPTSSPWIKMSIYVDRGSGYRTVYLVYDRASDQVKLMHDTNNNSVIEDSDELLLTPAITYNN